MSEQEKSLNRNNGTLRGVEVQFFRADTETWDEDSAVGWSVGNDAFFIGLDELPEQDGYATEITITKGALRRMLAALEG